MMKTSTGGLAMPLGDHASYYGVLVPIIMPASRQKIVWTCAEM